MNDIVLLTRAPESHAVTRLAEAAAGRTDLALHMVDPHEYYLYITGGHCEARHLLPAANPAGCVLIPRIGSLSTEYSLAALEMLERTGARSINSLPGVLRLRNKFLALAHLADAGLPVPDSAMLRMPSELAPAVARLGGYPVVLKFIRGSQGVGVVYAPDESVAASVLEALNIVQYDVLIQRYYARAGESDVRVLVLGGQARWSVSRAAPAGGFRSNLHRGGKALPTEISPELKGLAEKAASEFGLGLAGVDIIQGDDGPLVLEVNSSPGFNAIEQAHGADVAGAILDYAAGV